MLAEPIDISLPLSRSDRVSMPPSFYDFHITTDGDTFTNDNTLVNLDNPTNISIFIHTCRQYLNIFYTQFWLFAWNNDTYRIKLYFAAKISHFEE